MESIIITTRVWFEEGHFVAECPELEILISGDTFKQVQDMLNKSILKMADFLIEHEEKLAPVLRAQIPYAKLIRLKNEIDEKTF